MEKNYMCSKGNDLRLIGLNKEFFSKYLHKVQSEFECHEFVICNNQIEAKRNATPPNGKERLVIRQNV